MPAPSGRRKNVAYALHAWGAGLAAALVFSACTAAAQSSIPTSGAPPVTPGESPAATSSFVGDCCAPPTRPPYALVTARPSRDAAPSSVPVLPTASPTAADSLSEDGTDAFDRTVAAGGSISVPIDFEGSTWGSVAVYTKSDGQRVTFGGKDLQSQKGTLGGAYWAFGVSLDSPRNGDLVVKNTTGSAVEVFGLAMIYTRRHLTIEPSDRNPHKGQQDTFDVSLTEATDADDVTATLVDPQGNSTPASATKVGTGHWIVRASFSKVGDNVIRVSTTASRMRAAAADVTVDAGDVTLSSTFDEQVVDSDHDGLIDELDLTPTITVAEAGKYMANATLLDRSGVEVAGSAQGEISLVAGSQPLTLGFGGSDIYKSGRWGPYTLHVTILHDTMSTTTIELDDVVLGETAAYDYMQFQHDRIAVDPKSLSSKAVDTNGDGLFDELDLTGTATVENAGQYSINSGLYANNPWGQVAAEYMTFQLSAGPNRVTLVYKGSDIAKAGQDGPYLVPTLTIYLTADPMGDMPLGFVQYTTAAYKASQFAP
jgi:hypothetical protein